MLSTEEKREIIKNKTGDGEVVTKKTITGSVPQEKRGTNQERRIFQGAYLLYCIVGVIEVLLFLRLTFKIFEANPESGFVSFIYSVTDFFLAPFSGIFEKVLLDPSTFIAMFIYGIIGWGIFKLVGVFLIGKK